VNSNNAVDEIDRLFSPNLGQYERDMFKMYFQALSGSIERKLYYEGK